MVHETEQPTVGQEFTSRWMAQRNPAQYNSATLTRDITAAIDEYVNGRTDVDRTVLREVALEAANGNESFFVEATVEGKTVRVTAREVLRSQVLVAVANKHQLGGPQSWQFPV